MIQHLYQINGIKFFETNLKKFMYKDPFTYKRNYPPKLPDSQNPLTKSINPSKSGNYDTNYPTIENAVKKISEKYHSKGKENNIDSYNRHLKHDQKNCGSEDKNRNRQSKNDLKENQKLKEIQTQEKTKNPLLYSLNSNKASNALEQMKTAFRKVPSASKLINTPMKDKILADSISKDGKFRVVSKILTGQELAKAVDYQNKMSIKNRKNTYEQDLEKFQIPNFQPSKISNKENCNIIAYAVNTNRGCVRNYNQDRVSIILNINKKSVKSSFFAVYDGHGGSTCCDYLRDVLHQNIINHKMFPFEPKKAIKEGIKQCQQDFFRLVQKKYQQSGEIDRSGSCVIIVMVVGDECYVANVGDSRAIISAQEGKNAYSLSRDHKPTDSSQQQRIQKNGGNIYRTQIKKRSDSSSMLQGQKGLSKFSNSQSNLNSKSNDNVNVGPLRVFPGKLSITRTVGDIEAKHPKFGGKQNCIVPDPQIKKFRLQHNQDFIIIGCDGIFEKLDSSDVINITWRTIDKYIQMDTNSTKSIHDICGACVEEIIKASLALKSSDNLTVMMIGLIGLKQYIDKKTSEQKYNQNLLSYRSV